MRPSEITDFWRQAGPARWFAKDDAFDAEIRERFLDVHMQASTGGLGAWAAGADGALALTILLDQFPRNLFRGSAHAFACDPLARAVAEAALAAGHDRAVEPAMRPFFYLPFEHSEAPADQARSVALFEAHARISGDEDSLKWAVLHQEIVARFGRFPHRNACLGRTGTPEEQAFLDGGGFAG